MTPLSSFLLSHFLPTSDSYAVYQPFSPTFFLSHFISTPHYLYIFLLRGWRGFCTLQTWRLVILGRS